MLVHETGASVLATRKREQVKDRVSGLEGLVIGKLAQFGPPLGFEGSRGLLPLHYAHPLTGGTRVDHIIKGTAGLAPHLDHVVGI